MKDMVFPAGSEKSVGERILRKSSGRISHVLYLPFFYQFVAHDRGLSLHGAQRSWMCFREEDLLLAFRGAHYIRETFSLFAVFQDLSVNFTFCDHINFVFTFKPRPRCILSSLHEKLSILDMRPMGSILVLKDA